MYQNRSNQIDTRIGTGEAVVNDSSFVDLSELGKYLGSNSKHAKRKKQFDKVQEAYSDFEPDRKGLTMSQLEVYNPMLKDLADFTRSVEAQSDPNFYQNFEEKLRETVAVGQQFRSQADQYHKMGSGLHKDAEIDLYDGVDGFKRASSKEFAYDENGEMLDPTSLMAKMKMSMDGVQKNKIWDPFELLPEVETQKEGTASMSGNVETNIVNNVLTPEGLKVTRDVAERAVENAFSGKTGDPRQNRWLDMARERLNNQDPTLLASAKTEEEALTMLKKSAGDIAEERQRAKYEHKDKTQDYQRPPKTSGGNTDYDPKNYKISRESQPSTINVNGKEISTGLVERDAAAVKRIPLNVKDSAGNEVEGTLIKVSYDKDGNKVAIVNVPLKTGKDSYSTKNVEPTAVPYEEVIGQIDGKNKDLHDAMFGQMDPSASTYEGFTQEEINNIATQISDLSENYTAEGNNKLAQTLFGDLATEVYDPIGPSDFAITIDGKEHKFNLDDSDSKEKLINFAIEQRNKSNTPKPEEDTTTAEDLKITEGLDEADRKSFLSGKHKDMSDEGWSKAWEKLPVGKSMIGKDGKEYTKQAD